MKSGMNAYRGRKGKKRDFRSLWITRVNAGLRALGSSYSRFAGTCFKKDVRINKKMLAELAAREPKVFEEMVKQVIA